MSTQTVEPKKEVQCKVRKPSENDFYWSDEREPHFQRRQDILESHPEVKSLFGIDPTLKYTTVILVAIQLTVGYFMKDVSWIPFLLISYFVGATIIHALFLAVHEITHDLAFTAKWKNNVLSFVANLPMVAPYSMSFKTYHAMHHWEQGKDGVDTDIPTEVEAKIFRGFLGKVIWFLHQILFYALRPMMVKRIKVDKWMIRNISFQVVGMALYYYIAGPVGFLYLLMSMLLAGG
ncbi:MAG: hypothetical protein GY810_32680, partial [Aureispira sp.]|nr:hypothetical protein [Aureispira sp.]